MGWLLYLLYGLLPYHLVEKVGPNEPKILSHSCGEWYCVNDVGQVSGLEK